MQVAAAGATGDGGGGGGAGHDCMMYLLVFPTLKRCFLP